MVMKCFVAQYRVSKLGQGRGMPISFLRYVSTSYSYVMCEPKTKKGDNAQKISRTENYVVQNVDQTYELKYSAKPTSFDRPKKKKKT